MGPLTSFKALLLNVCTYVFACGWNLFNLDNVKGKFV